MESCILTNGGNLLRFHPEIKGWYFQKPNGEFLREVSQREAEFICENGLQIDVHFPNPHPKEFPKWNLIGSYLVVNDHSNFRWDTCNNGGNYSFQTYHDWFVSQVNDKTVFRFVERHDTSAEFSFDELTGRFEKNLDYLEITNIGGTIKSDNKFWYRTQCLNPEQLSYIPEVLEKISEEGTFEQFWNLQSQFIPSKWEDDEQESRIWGLTFSDKKEIVRLLKYEYGINLREGMKRLPNRGYIKNNRR